MGRVDEVESLLDRAVTVADTEMDECLEMSEHQNAALLALIIDCIDEARNKLHGIQRF